MSESAGGESNERLLFPKELQAELGMVNISFNPVAPTMMIKILSRVANQESSYVSNELSMCIHMWKILFIGH
jgi:cell cycle checkpoint protein